MMMYESDGSTLVLNYGDKIPGASEIICDIIEAPIEQQSAESKKTKKKETNETKLVVSSNSMFGQKVVDEVAEAVKPYGFKKLKDGFAFSIPEDGISEQAALMR